MKPEELLDTENLPPELQWVAAHYQLHPEDPVYLLIAWHWHRVQAAENTLQAAIVEMKAAMDVRIEALVEAADTISGINTGLEAVQKELADRPALLSQELETQLRQPVKNTVTELESMIRSLEPAARSFRALPRRLLLATLLTGLALGSIGTLILRLA
jgi:gamma-glutamyl:cysteine ligase YbdK (ATP-grasp superfamily)